MLQSIGLLACAKTKRAGSHRAEDLYLSPLFTMGKEYLRRNCDQWFILSAKHGLLRPETVIDDYNITLNTFNSDQRKAWSEMVWGQIKPLLADGPVKIVFIAGSKYREGLEGRLAAAECQVEVPMAGLGIGKQLGWLKSRVS